MPPGGELEFGARCVLPGTGTGLEVSRLGFGTSALMSRVNRRDSVQLLQTALEEGITHIDTARSYGFGEAELAVGDVLAGRRDRITVTTKAGIVPPRGFVGLATAKAAVRRLLAVVPGARAAVRRRAGGLVTTNCFDVKTMAESLHASLRQLRTDYVDFLLLHEPSCDVLSTDEPLEFLHRMQREGKVRSYGIAATPAVAAFAEEHAPAYAGIVQVPNSVFLPQMRIVRSEQAVFTYSAFGTLLAELRMELESESEVAQHWSSELQTDVTEHTVLERLALQWSLAHPGGNVVLFTSTKEKHVRENAAVLRTAASLDQLKRFEELVREWMNVRRRPKTAGSLRE